MTTDTKPTTAIVLAPSTAPAAPGLLRPIATPAEFVEVHKEGVALIRDALDEGRDYGRIPGTGNKPTLLKPGAERLALAFGCHPVYSVVEKEIDHDRKNVTPKGGTSLGLYRYVVRCTLVRHDGQEVGDGIASCSTMESKYITRPRDCENTALKMAQKRALVGAVLNAFGLSDRFTQDVDDSDETTDAEYEETPRAAPPTKPAPKPQPTPAERLAAAVKWAAGHAARVLAAAAVPPDASPDARKAAQEAVAKVRAADKRGVDGLKSVDERLHVAVRAGGDVVEAEVLGLVYEISEEERAAQAWAEDLPGWDAVKWTLERPAAAEQTGTTK